MQATKRWSVIKNDENRHKQKDDCGGDVGDVVNVLRINERKRGRDENDQKGWHGTCAVEAGRKYVWLQHYVGQPRSFGHIDVQWRDGRYEDERRDDNGLTT